MEGQKDQCVSNASVVVAFTSDDSSGRNILARVQNKNRDNSVMPTTSDCLPFSSGKLSEFGFLCEEFLYLATVMSDSTFGRSPGTFC